jgi:hypothetical protein
VKPSSKELAENHLYWHRRRIIMVNIRFKHTPFRHVIDMFTLTLSVFSCIFLCSL